MGRGLAGVLGIGAVDMDVADCPGGPVEEAAPEAPAALVDSAIARLEVERKHRDDLEHGRMCSGHVTAKDDMKPPVGLAVRVKDDVVTMPVP